MSTEKQYNAIAIAKIAHTMNKQFCELMGDTSQVDWDEAPFNIRNSAIDGVVYVIEHPSAKEGEMHENWLRFKEADGWVYGDVKDPVKKTHPSMVPYSQLSKEDKIKDYLFLSVAKGLLGYL